MEYTTQLHQLALALVTGVGTKMARHLIHQTGSVSSIFSEKPGVMAKIPRITPRIIEGIQNPQILKRAEEEIQFMKKKGISMVFFTDENYPLQLRNCADAPIVLFFKGQLPFRMRHSLSVIGTRNPTQKGRQITRKWIGELSQHYPDLYIISGLAYGIDVVAHEAALEYGLTTLAVLGHGFHTLYPSMHTKVAQRILEKGALLCDFFSNNRREPKNFIRRNRIIAGITEATLVIESAFKGGAMTTAEMANSYNREDFAVPGRPGDEKSIGCNYLIRSHQAALIQDSSDIAFQLNWTTKNPAGNAPSDPEKALVLLNKLQNRIIELLQEQPLTLDELCMRIKLPQQQLIGELMTLEFEGLINALPGNRFALGNA